MKTQKEIMAALSDEERAAVAAEVKAIYAEIEAHEQADEVARRQAGPATD